MWKNVLRGLAVLAGVGIVVTAGILFLQVNFHDLRAKYAYRDPSDLNLQIGGFYAINSQGNLRGPVCAVPQDELAMILKKSREDLLLTNTLGSQVPLIADWTTNVVGSLEGEWLDQLVKIGAEDAEDRIKFTGYTLELKGVEVESIESFSASAAMNKLLWKNEECASELDKLYLRGECVVSIFKTVRFAGRVIGLKLYDDSDCYIRAAQDGEETPKILHVPAERSGLLAFLAQVKVKSGFVDTLVSSEDVALSLSEE